MLILDLVMIQVRSAEYRGADGIVRVNGCHEGVRS